MLFLVLKRCLSSVLTESWGGFLFALLALLSVFFFSATSTAQSKSQNIGLHGQLPHLVTHDFVQMFLKAEVFLGRPNWAHSSDICARYSIDVKANSLCSL